MAKNPADNMDWFQERIAQTQARVGVMHTAAGDPAPHTSGLLPELFEELSISLEELQVTGEEMRQQNEALGEAQLTIAEERRRYQDLFDAAPTPYIVTDALGHVQEANRAACEMLGLTARRLSGKPLAVYVAADARAAFRAGLDRCRASDCPAEWETTLHPRGRDPFPAALTVSGERDAAGNLTTLRWLVQDISERRAWEQALREANRDLEVRVRERTQEIEDSRNHVSSILESITDMFYAVDADFRLTYVNRRAEEIWGRSRAELIGQHFWTVFPQTDGSEAYGHHLRAMTERTSAHYETLSSLLGRWIEVHVHPTSEGGLSVYFRDISDRKQVEATERQERDRTRRIADTLQTALLQTIPEDAFPPLEVSTLYKAASDEALVGGDFFDAFPVDHGKVALVVGDVTGKGLSAASHTAEVKFALRAFLREMPWPGRALARLNDFVCEAQRQDEWANASLVVLALVVLDPATGEAVYASAGAEPLLIVPPEGGAVEEHGRGSGLVLGVMPQRDYEETTLTLPPGGMLLMATDGITEARRHGEMLGLEGLQRLALEARALGEVGEISRAIVDATRDYAGGVQADDVCLLLARRRAG